MTRAKAKKPVPGVTPPGGRTAPEWMDPKGEHGELTVLLMEPANRDHKLPNNPFIIARSVKEQIGSIAAAYRDKEGNMVVKVRCPKKAAKLQEMKQLIDGTKVKVAEHARLNQVRCIVTCNSVSELSDEELTEELAEQGVIEVRRLGRRDARSATMVVTLRGTVVPPEIHFGYDLCRTREFKQAPMQCYRCFGYGHTKARCPAGMEELCRNCSKQHEIQKDDEGRTICKAPTFCKHCSGGHSPTSRACPKYREEEAINEIRTKEDKSPREARRLYEERKAATSGSYAAVTNNNNNSNNEMAKELEATKRALKEAMSELAKLRKEVQKATTNSQQTPPNPAQNKTNLTAANSVESIANSDTDLDEEVRKRKLSTSSSNEEESDSNDESDGSEDSQKQAPVVPPKNNPASAKGDFAKPKKPEPTPPAKPEKPQNIPKKHKNSSGQKTPTPINPSKKKL